MFLSPLHNAPTTKILVFSKTEGYRHESIDAGKAALRQLAEENDVTVDFTEDASQFTKNTLDDYQAVVFLHTTGDVLNDEQQTAFERYIQAGGGYVGVHSATDTEYDWPWYGGLAGAYFLDHPMNPSNVQKGTFTVTQPNHWATRGMPKTFEREDEFYSFRNISPHINVVLTLDDSSYIGGNNPDFHPMSWYQEYDGGRSFYTALGHTDAAFSDPLFLNHLWAGIHYATGGDNPSALDYTWARPEENRFTKVVLAEKLDEPMELTLLDENRVLFIQRKGEVRLYNLRTEELKTIAQIPVSTKYVNREGEESTAEDGLLGLNKDPNFAQNHWIYLYYSTPEAPKNVLARFEMDGDELVMDSKKVLLEVPVQREECCHTGGSIAWDAKGNLYLSTGDNTNPHASDGFSPSDERPDRSPWDAQKSSANTNDLRGKIIRIHPESDGTYTIPAGNLFAEGTDQARPEIYTMGHRNPFRISVDPKTGYLYWGDVGPDAAQSDSTRGPAGHDEVGQARQAGNYGWPHFVADNKAYHRYDFASQQSGEKWDVKAPQNTSPNNTGLQSLPPAQPAFIWYPYAESTEFPLVGSGGRNAMAGPVYYSDQFAGAERAFPDYYNGKLLAYEWMRGWIMAVTMNEDGDFMSMERFMPSYTFSNPMDMTFAENGDLFMLEYGTGWFAQNDDARLVRIEYNGGNRKPQIAMAANQTGGTAPMDLTLSAEGTQDPDGDELSYTWEVTSDNGFSQQVAEPQAQLTLSEKGVYQAKLTVDDGQGGKASQTQEIIVGNDMPVVQVSMPGGNRSFFVPNQPFQYDVQVQDQEDGTLGNGINAQQVALNIDYLAEGYDKVAIARGHRSADDQALASAGQTLIEGSDCKACHSMDKKSVGPSYQAIAEKYTDNSDTRQQLAQKIIAGGGGVWGEVAMSAHPQLSTEDAAEMVKYILNVTKEGSAGSDLPMQGSYEATLPTDDPGQGVYILRAAYQDQGAEGLPPLRAEQTLVLRNTKVDVHNFDDYNEIRKMSFGGNNLAIPGKSDAYMKLAQIDLNGLAELQVMASAPKPRLEAIGGKIELRVDSPDGPVIGESEMLEPSEKMDFTPSLLRVPFQPTSDMLVQPHDVYLVFVNPSSTGAESLMVVSATEFKLEETVANE